MANARLDRARLLNKGYRYEPTVESSSAANNEPVGRLASLIELENPSGIDTTIKSDVGCCLTQEECFYLFSSVLSTSFLERSHYTILKEITDKVYKGAEGYKPNV